MSSWTAYAVAREKEVKNLNSLIQKIEKAKGEKRVALLAELKACTEPYEYDYLTSNYVK